jgi:hypothetical protein
MPSNQFLDPMMEAPTSRFANAQAEVLEWATDLVFEIALDLDQLGPAV